MTKIFFLKQDEKFISSVRKFFPQIEFEIKEDELVFESESEIISQMKKLKKSQNQICLEIAFQKAKMAQENQIKEEKGFFIGFSSLLFLGNRVLEAPSSPEQALRQMKLISGRRSRIYSGFCLISNQKIHQKENSLIIKLKHLDQSEIKNYIEKEYWKNQFCIMNLEGEISKFINFVNGSYQAGLYRIPIFELNSVLSQYFK